MVLNESFESFDYKKQPKSRQKTLPVILELKAEYTDEPIIMIQKNYKMLKARKDYLKLKKAAIVIQRWTRMNSVKTLYQNILSAIIFIQRFWRLVRLHKKAFHNPLN